MIEWRDVFFFGLGVGALLFGEVTGFAIIVIKTMIKQGKAAKNIDKKLQDYINNVS